MEKEINVLKRKNPDNIKDPVRPTNQLGRNECCVSIIIAAYNDEKNIKKSLLSAVEQNTLIKYEIIIVNDGSSDGTHDVITKLINSYPNKKVKYINQENRGFSGARNAGLDIATGEYIFFLDSDDYISNNTIDDLYRKSNNGDNDVVDGSIVRFVGPVKKRLVRPATGYFGYPCGKLIKRKLFQNVRFPENAWFEDTIVGFLIMPFVRKISFCDTAIYYYRKNFKGISTSAKRNIKSFDSYYLLKIMHESQKKMLVPWSIENDKRYSAHIEITLRRIKHQNRELRSIVLRDLNDWMVDNGHERIKMIEKGRVIKNKLAE